MDRAGFVALLFCVPTVSACESPPASAPAAASAPVPVSASAAVSALASSSSSAPAPAPALTSASAIVDLPIPGHSAAVVSLPLGTTSKRPVIIAAHGNYDRPEWQCDVWRSLLGARANHVFVLCPRGVRRPDSPSPDDVRFTYENNAALEREIDAGLAALSAAYSDFVDPGPVVHAGFSLGAIQGVAIAGRRPERSPRLVLIEGGHAAWKPEVVSAFAKIEGARVLFVCSQSGCAADARWAASRLEKAGVETKIAKSANVGHRYDGPVAETTRSALEWVFEGDARFEVEAKAPAPRP
ncbi:hypothetical protein [Polyangium sp. 15x6]|uniref:hypothetical protein n=1 Tax=Polyangium sp. 15x6 TaxID=3042687 RepID=UPI00249A6362|nr:hypothetical protein [Polyangium sp. 15x6]